MKPFVLLSLCLAAVSCKKESAATGAMFTPPFAHGVQLYVNAVNCEMNAENARELDAFANASGVAVEVVLVGVPGNDSTIATQIRNELGLHVPSRMMRDGELSRFKTIGIARMPMAVMIKGKQLSTLVSGEMLPRTLELIHAEFHH